MDNFPLIPPGQLKKDRVCTQTHVVTLNLSRCESDEAVSWHTRTETFEPSHQKGSFNTPLPPPVSNIQVKP